MNEWKRGLDFEVDRTKPNPFRPYDEMCDQVRQGRHVVLIPVEGGTYRYSGKFKETDDQDVEFKRIVGMAGRAHKAAKAEGMKPRVELT